MTASTLDKDLREKLEAFPGLTKHQKFICHLAVNLKIAVDQQQMSMECYHVLGNLMNAISMSCLPEDTPQEEVEKVDKAAGEYMDMYFKICYQHAERHISEMSAEAQGEIKKELTLAQKMGLVQ